MNSMLPPGIVAESDPCQQQWLARCAARHTRLCPRQVLGVRMGLLGARLLGLEAPRTDKRLLVIVESDGCGADGIEVVTGCQIGRRTLRVLDFGKLAATFVDIETGQATRVAPRPDIRELAWLFAREAESNWHAQLTAYQIMPGDMLFQTQDILLQPDLAALMGTSGQRVQCSVCREEILNSREMIRDGKILCRACAGGGYYIPRP